MIYLGYLGEAKNIVFKPNDAKYIIVRNPTGKIPKGFIHLPELSPSVDLFNNALRWKRGEYRNKEVEFLKINRIDKSKEEPWFLLYRPMFEKELRERLYLNITPKNSPTSLGGGMNCL